MKRLRALIERFMKVLPRSAFLGLALTGILSGAVVPTAWADTGDIYVMEVSGTINPGLAQYVIRSMEKASSEGAVCLVIQLDTPGGLVLSMRSIVMAMLAS
ncbi:MAG: hypothetical protein JRF69_07515, partial [Deltaproteobacteria bacterium]|nr:hypothetical protein [Deltaproteobacteria bacterium]